MVSLLVWGGGARIFARLPRLEAGLIEDRAGQGQGGEAGARLSYHVDYLVVFAQDASAAWAAPRAS
jgi:hypothetical protein